RVEREADERAAAHLAVPPLLERLDLRVEAREILGVERDADHVVVRRLRLRPAATARRRHPLRRPLRLIEGVAEDLPQLVALEGVLHPSAVAHVGSSYPASALTCSTGATSPRMRTMRSTKAR